MTPSLPYVPRIVDAELEARLRAEGAGVIEGPKASGKTWTARRLAASEVRLDVDEEARRAASIDPSLILDRPAPLLIDEWQVEPQIWNHIRRAVDDRGAPGQFILTGSAVPPDDVTRHSGAGRLSRLRMRPMSLVELGRSSGAVSLAAVLGGGPIAAADAGLTIADIAELVSRGGWPGLRDRTTSAAGQAVRDYLAEIARTDVSRVDGTRRDPARVGRLLRSIARNTSTHAATAALAADTLDAGAELRPNTVSEYLDALERLMVVEDQPAWAPHLRSRHRLRRAAKRHFVDPSLAAAALATTPERFLGDLGYLGFLFESLVVRDLRIYAQAVGGRVLQYRDSDGLEVDAVVELDDARWAGFEVKLGQAGIDQAARSLLRFADRIDTGRCGPPAALAVIVATGYAYRRPDGVAVIPIGALGP